MSEQVKKANFSTYEKELNHLVLKLVELGNKLFAIEFAISKLSRSIIKSISFGVIIISGIFVLSILSVFSFIIVLISHTVGTPIAITGTPRYSSSIRFLLFPKLPLFQGQLS